MPRPGSLGKTRAARTGILVGRRGFPLAFFCLLCYSILDWFPHPVQPAGGEAPLRRCAVRAPYSKYQNGGKDTCAQKPICWPSTGVIAAAYAALTLVAAALNLAYGPVQFRFSEALTVPPFLFPGTWPGGFRGVPGGKPAQPLRPLDVVLGSAGTLVAALLTQKAPKTWLAPLPPVVCGMVLLGGMLAWYEVGFSDQFLPSSRPMRCGWASARRCPAMGWGLPLPRALRKVSYFRRFIPEDRRGLRPAA